VFNSSTQINLFLSDPATTNAQRTDEVQTAGELIHGGEDAGQQGVQKSALQPSPAIAQVRQPFLFNCGAQSDFKLSDPVETINY
jgi:hypothetical protein